MKSIECGLLWFDDSRDKALEKKVGDAVAAYCAKARFEDREPDVCYVHLSMLPEGERESRLNGVRVVTTGNVAPNYFLVGEERTREVDLGGLP